ncbi:MAG: hypothetical protein ABI310_06050 [Microbacteriaceae bacterium]
MGDLLVATPDAPEVTRLAQATQALRFSLADVSSPSKLADGELLATLSAAEETGRLIGDSSWVRPSLCRRISLACAHRGIQRERMRWHPELLESTQPKQS